MAYMCEANIAYGKVDAPCILVQTAGRELKMDGVLEKEFALYKPVEPGGTLSYEFVMKRGATGNRYTDTVSTPLKGSVRYQAH
jgi:hypothetical protein